MFGLTETLEGTYLNDISLSRHNYLFNPDHFTKFCCSKLVQKSREILDLLFLKLLPHFLSFSWVSFSLPLSLESMLLKFQRILFQNLRLEHKRWNSQVMSQYYSLKNYICTFYYCVFDLNKVFGSPKDVVDQKLFSFII